MKGKHGAGQVRRFPRPAFLVICAGLLITVVAFGISDLGFASEHPTPLLQNYHPGSQSLATPPKQGGELSDPGSQGVDTRPTVSPDAVIFSETFDAVIPPALPGGWTTAQSGSGTNFVTQSANTGNTTRSAFTTNPATSGSSELVSAPVSLGSVPTRLSFRHLYITEPTAGYDGGVLEISVGGGAFQDIVSAGGTFQTGGYVQAILPDAAGNPLIGRQAWTGVGTAYILTTVNLPAIVANQSVRFKWRYATDEIVAGQGWWIDDVSVSTVAIAPPGITHTVTNPSPISIPASGAGAPYPSIINVTNVPIQLAKVTVKLNMMSHTFPSDVDIMVVGPQGQTAVIMSDVGGSLDINGVTLTLDDEAGIPMPAAGQLATGSYIPTNSGLADVFPAPAPAQSGGSALSVFNGTNPNGQWRLFVFDDVGVDSGNITGGWTLTLTPAISGQNTSAITIPESGTGSPYPSDITVTDHADPVSFVQVNLTNFSHTSTHDVDIMLVSPGGRSVVLMSDAGGNRSVSNLNLTFTDAGPSLPFDAAITSGSYRPTDYEPGDVFPAPAPPAGPGRTLSSMNGTVANGAWRLFVVDDTGGNVGNVEGGWSVLVGTSNNMITIAGGAIASQYPSEVSVSGLPGSITKATVTLTNFSHLAPDDVDMLLVGPDGRRIVLMSDAGGINEVGGANLTFDDLAPSAIPDSTQISTGTYRPADYDPGEVFPAPAPGGPPTGTTLNAFYGGVPNGIWRLYIVGDGSSSFGTIAGAWTMTLQTSVSACLHSLSPSVQAFPTAGGSGSFNVIQPTGCSWTASTIDPFITITSGNSGGGNGQVEFTVAPNQGHARTGSIDVTNGVATRTVQIQQASGCPLAVGQSSLNFAAAGGMGSVAVSAGAPCSWQGATFESWVQITSPPQSGNGTLTFNVQPNTQRTPRTATIEIGSMVVEIRQAPPRATPFDFDGDSRTDVSVFRPSTGTWWIARSTGGNSATQFGVSTDRIVPGDYDGDSKTDIAVYRDGTWYVLKSSDGTAAITAWGTATDIPVPGDYNSDASADLAVFRPATGAWWILKPDGTYISTAFGLETDIPTPGEYDGDGKTDISVYRAATMAGEQGTWWTLRSSDGGVSQTVFGIQGDKPVGHDFDGDGRDNVAVYRPSTGFWYRSTDASRNYDAVQWGIPGDILAAGDYDGDGKIDPAVVRPGASAIWYLLGSTSGSVGVQFGTTGDKPAPSAYVP